MSDTRVRRVPVNSPTVETARQALVDQLARTRVNVVNIDTPAAPEAVTVSLHQAMIVVTNQPGEMFTWVFTVEFARP